jgi:hypothetical protein
MFGNLKLNILKNLNSYDEYAEKIRNVKLLCCKIFFMCLINLGPDMNAIHMLLVELLYLLRAMMIIEARKLCAFGAITS